MTQSFPSVDDVLTVFSQHSRAMHAGEVAARLHVAPEDRPRFVDLLQELAEEGALRQLAGKRFRSGGKKKRASRAKSRSEVAAVPTVEGTLTVHPRGFGFLNLVGHDDVFIPAENIGPALHGDTVAVEVTGHSRKGPEGRVDSIVSRRSARVAGLLQKRRKSSWLEPDDTRLRGPILITEGAKAAKDGAAVVVEITRFPQSSDENPEGRLLAELGEPGNHDVEVQKILLREQVDEQHPPEALAEAEQLSARRMPIDQHGRKDLRHLPFLTIDPEDARDHDDAIWVERREGGGYRLYVAIADVSEYVTPGTALDAEALERSFTIYLPNRAVPMLPSALAADLCSLLPEQDRLCLCVSMILDSTGKITRTQVVEGVIRAAAFLTYGSVAQTLGFTDQYTAQPAALAFKKNLKALDEVTRKLRRSRMRRGALDLDLPEPKLTLDKETEAPSWVERRTQDPGVKRAYQMVEECMLAANEVVARWLAKRHSAALYRVHAKPDEEKLERLGKICDILDVPFDPDEVLEPKGLSLFLKRTANHEKSSVLEGLLLRSLKQAAYDVHNIGHFGLAAKSYLHFTSPIRRYPDLMVHRLVKHLLRKNPADESPEFLEELAKLATRASARERAVMLVEREVMDLYRALLMRDYVGDTFDGRVTAITQSGLYVALDQPFVDVMVPFEALGPDQYGADDSELFVVGARSGDQVGLGDRITVQVNDVALERRTTYARRVIPAKLLARLEAADEGGSRGRGSKRGSSDGRKGSSRGKAARRGDSGGDSRGSGRRDESQGARGSKRRSSGGSSTGRTASGKSGAKKGSSKGRSSKKGRRR